MHVIDFNDCPVVRQVIPVVVEGYAPGAGNGHAGIGASHPGCALVDVKFAVRVYGVEDVDVVKRLDLQAVVLALWQSLVVFGHLVKQALGTVQQGC